MSKKVNALANESTELIKKIKELDFNTDEIDALDEDERIRTYINFGMQLVNQINQVEVHIHEISKLVRMLIPEPIEDIKILLARLEDIEPDKIEELSLGFIKQTFIVNGRNLKVTFPEVGEVNDLEFYRLVIHELKTLDEITGMYVNIISELRNKFNTKIPDEVKKLLSNVEELDEWMINNIKKKIEDASLTDKQRKQFEEQLKYMEYSYTLTPIIENVRKQIESKGSSSILHGYRNNSANVLAAAINICKEKGILFPFQMYDNIEKKLLGDKYKPYNNLFSFLIARYIKYRKNELTDNEKIFLTNLNSHLVVLKRAKDLSKVEKTASRLTKAIDELLGLVTK